MINSIPENSSDYSVEYVDEAKPTDYTNIIIVVVIIIFIIAVYFIYTKFKKPEVPTKAPTIINNEKVETVKPIFQCPSIRPTIITKNGKKTCINEETDPIICNTLDSNSFKNTKPKTGDWFTRSRRADIIYKKKRDPNCNGGGITCCKDPSQNEMSKQCIANKNVWHLNNCYESMNCSTAPPYKQNAGSPDFGWKADENSFFTKCRKLNDTELRNSCESKNYTISINSDRKQECIKGMPKFKVQVMGWYNDSVNLAIDMPKSASGTSGDASNTTISASISQIDSGGNRIDDFLVNKYVDYQTINTANFLASSITIKEKEPDQNRLYGSITLPGYNRNIFKQGYKYVFKYSYVSDAAANLPSLTTASPSETARYKKQLQNYISVFEKTETCDIDSSMKMYDVKYRLESVKIVQPDPRIIPKNYLWEEDKIYYRRYDHTKDEGFLEHRQVNPNKDTCAQWEGSEIMEKCLLDYRNRCTDGSSSCVINTDLSTQYVGGSHYDRNYKTINYKYEPYLLEFCKKGFPIRDGMCKDTGTLNLIFSIKWKIPEAYIVAPKSQSSKPNIRRLINNGLFFKCELRSAQGGHNLGALRSTGGETYWENDYEFQHFFKNTSASELQKLGIRGKLLASKERSISQFTGAPIVQSGNSMQLSSAVDNDNCLGGPCPRFKIYYEVDDTRRSWFIEFVAKPNTSLEQASYYIMASYPEFKNASFGGNINSPDLANTVQGSEQVEYITTPRFTDDMCKKCDIVSNLYSSPPDLTTMHKIFLSKQVCSNYNKTYKFNIKKYNRIKANIDNTIKPPYQREERGFSRLGADGTSIINSSYSDPNDTMLKHGIFLSYSLIDKKYYTDKLLQNTYQDKIKIYITKLCTEIIECGGSPKKTRKYTLNEVRNILIKDLQSDANLLTHIQMFDITFSAMINSGCITLDAIINMQSNKNDVCYNSSQTFRKGYSSKSIETLVSDTIDNVANLSPYKSNKSIIQEVIKSLVSSDKSLGEVMQARPQTIKNQAYKVVSEMMKYEYIIRNDTPNNDTYGNCNAEFIDVWMTSNEKRAICSSATKEELKESCFKNSKLGSGTLDEILDPSKKGKVGDEPELNVWCDSANCNYTGCVKVNPTFLDGGDGGFKCYPKVKGKLGGECHTNTRDNCGRDCYVSDNYVCKNPHLYRSSGGSKAKVRFKGGDITFDKLTELLPEKVSFSTNEPVEIKKGGKVTNDAIKNTWKRILRPEKSYRIDKQFGVPSHLCVDQKNSNALKGSYDDIPTISESGESYDNKWSEYHTKSPLEPDWAGINYMDSSKKIVDQITTNTKSKCPECRCYTNTQVNTCCNIQNNTYGKPCWEAGLDHLMCADSTKIGARITPACKEYSFGDVNSRCDVANNYIDANYWIDNDATLLRFLEHYDQITKLLKRLKDTDWTSIIETKDIKTSDDAETIKDKDGKVSSMYNYLESHQKEITGRYCPDFKSDTTLYDFYDKYKNKVISPPWRPKGLKIVMTKLLRDLNQLDWTRILGYPNIKNSTDVEKITVASTGSVSIKKMYGFVINNHDSIKAMYGSDNFKTYSDFYKFLQKYKAGAVADTQSQYGTFSNKCVNIAVPYQAGSDEFPNNPINKSEVQLNQASTDEWTSDNKIYLTQDVVNNEITSDRDSYIACRGIANKSSYVKVRDKTSENKRYNEIRKPGGCGGTHYPPPEKTSCSADQVVKPCGVFMEDRKPSWWNE